MFPLFLDSFDIRQDCFFTTAVRSRIVEFILDRQRFPAKNQHDMAFGIERLIAEGVYSAAYPLHDVGNRLNPRHMKLIKLNINYRIDIL